MPCAWTRHSVCAQEVWINRGARSWRRRLRCGGAGHRPCSWGSWTGMVSRKRIILQGKLKCVRGRKTGCVVGRDWSTPEKAQGHWWGIKGRKWKGVDVATNTSIEVLCKLSVVILHAGNQIQSSTHISHKGSTTEPHQPCVEAIIIPIHRSGN